MADIPEHDPFSHVVLDHSNNWMCSICGRTVKLVGDWRWEHWEPER